MEFISKLRVRGILIIASIFLLSLAYNTLARSAPPSLDEVLKRPGSSLDWGVLVFGFFALSLSALSLAKAYDIFKKSPDSKEETPSAFDDTEIKKLKKDIVEFKDSLKGKTKENEELQNKLNEIKEKLRLELSRGSSPNLFPVKQGSIQKKPRAKSKPSSRKKTK